MAKGQVSDKELATGLKTFGGFGALGEASARPRREDPFRDTRAEAAPQPPRIEVVKTPPAEPLAPPPLPEASEPIKVREKRPAVSRLTRAERRPEPIPEPEPSAAEKKSELYTERVTVPLDPELRDAAEALAKNLQRRRTDKGERITSNTVMRVALRILLDGFDAASAGVVNTEDELYEAVSARFRNAKKVTNR
jgi:hypothetical protein